MFGLRKTKFTNGTLFPESIFAPVLGDPYDLPNFEIISIGNVLNEFNEGFFTLEERLDVAMPRSHELETTRVFSCAKYNAGGTGSGLHTMGVNSMMLTLSCLNHPRRASAAQTRQQGGPIDGTIPTSVPKPVRYKSPKIKFHSSLETPENSSPRIFRVAPETQSVKFKE